MDKTSNVYLSSSTVIIPGTAVDINNFTTNRLVSSVFPSVTGYDYSYFNTVNNSPNYLNVNVFGLNGQGYVDVIVYNRAGYTKLSDKGFLISCDIPTYTLNNFNPHVYIYNTYAPTLNLNGISLISTTPSVLEARGLDFPDIASLSAFSRSVNVKGIDYTIYYDAMRCGESFYLSGTDINEPVFLPVLSTYNVPVQPPLSTYDQILYFATRSDGLTGTGTQSDPYASTVLDTVLYPLSWNHVDNICITLSSGVYETTAGQGTALGNPSSYDRPEWKGWTMQNNWAISGQGSSTILRYVSCFRDTYFGNLSSNFITGGRKRLLPGGLTSGGDMVSGFCLTNFVIDAASSTTTRRNISTITWNKTAYPPLQIITTTPHPLTGGDVFAIGGIIWKDANGTTWSQESEGHEWIIDQPSDGTSWVSTNGISARPYNFSMPTVNVSAAYTVATPQIALCNSTCFSFRNAGSNFVQNVTGYGTGPIYENLGIMGMASVGWQDAGRGRYQQFSKNNLIDSCVAITVPFSGENYERYGTGFGCLANNENWNYSYGANSFTLLSGCNAFLSMIVSNCWSYNGCQAYGVYGLCNTHFVNNSSNNNAVGWFTDTGVNVGTYIYNNTFLNNRNWGMIINAPIFRNGYIFNNIFTTAANNYTEGLHAWLGSGEPQNSYKRSFANTQFFNNKFYGFKQLYSVDATVDHLGYTPLSAIMTLSNNVTAGPYLTDPDVQVYYDNLIAAGVTINNGNIFAIQTAVQDLKGTLVNSTNNPSGYDIWSAIGLMGLFTGFDNYQGCFIPLKNTVGANLVNYGFNSSDFSYNSGLKGNGLSKYIDLGVADTAVFETPSKNHFLFWQRYVPSPVGTVFGNQMGNGQPGHLGLVETGAATRYSNFTQFEIAVSNVYSETLNGSIRVLGLNSYASAFPSKNTIAGPIGLSDGNNLLLYAQDSLTSFSNTKLAFYSLGDRLADSNSSSLQIAYYNVYNNIIGTLMSSFT